MADITIHNVAGEIVEQFNKISDQLGLPTDQLFADMIATYSQFKLGHIRKKLANDIYNILQSQQASTNIYVKRGIFLRDMSSDIDTVQNTIVLDNSAKLPNRSMAFIGVYNRDLVVRFDFDTVSSKKTQKFFNLFSQNETWFENNGFGEPKQKRKSFIIESRKSIQDWHLVSAQSIADTFIGMCKYLDLV